MVVCEGKRGMRYQGELREKLVNSQKKCGVDKRVDLSLVRGNYSVDHCMVRRLQCKK